ncbi:MAG: YtxH domain-containing protein [Candidatus Gracilibacteria bacterium]|jgi:gas vesicle protein
MDTHDSSDQKGKGPLSAGLGFAIAMALGATLGILFAPKEGTETQKDIMDKAQQLAKKFNKNREDVQTIVKNIFGEVSDELEKDFLELQGDILATADDIKDKTELTQKKYDEIVHDAVKQFSKGKKWTEKSVHSLIEEFKKDWK